MKVAIACSGLGRVKRGFETFAMDLYRLFEGRGIDVTLFKGGGAASGNEIPVWNISRNSRIWGAVPFVDPYIGEQMSFALPLSRMLKRQHFDIVQLSDGQLGSILIRLQPTESRGFRVLYSNGGPLDPSDYEQFDFIQQVNPVELNRALEYGYSAERMALVPYGISPDRFEKNDGNDLREELGIQGGLPVILSVGAHGGHKRLEFLIREIARLNTTFHLLIVGEESKSRTPFLRSLAANLLADRVTFLDLPHDRIPSAYALADLYVHAALKEGFGLALLEAMAAGLPAIHHDEPGMNWLVGDAGLAVDMTDEGNLIKTLNALITDSALMTRLGQRGRGRAESKFSWQVLLPRYAEMYEEALRLRFGR